jgi:IclR family KDG regulon transcriptional repressor
MSLSSNEKLLSILIAFKDNPGPLGASDLSNKLGISQPTASRALKALASFDLLQQEPRTRKYTLGNAISGLAEMVRNSFEEQLLEIAKPYLKELRDTIGESIGFEVIYNGKSWMVYEVHGENPVKVAFGTGTTMPLHAACGAKAMLAFYPDTEIDKLIPDKMGRYTPNTITRRSELKAQLSEIRQKGVAYDQGEIDEDVYSVAAPVFDHNNKAVAAVTVGSFSSRMKVLFEGDIAETVKKTDQEISERLAELKEH